MMNDINSLLCMEQPQCLISSCTYDKRLSSDADGKMLSTKNKLSWEEWTLELKTMEEEDGELCFLSLPERDERISCDVAGKLFMSKNWKG
eukprot:15363507-Ditylum_brightwellii.AAC.1